MHLPLEEYQERTLETLTEYYQKCLRLQNANTAFYDLTERPYAAVDGLPGMPYICLRLPTGGGKTFVACHAVGITASELLKTESPIVLWLVPSNAIRDQTLNALKNPNHPYRDAFESARHRVEVRTISEALYLSPHILNTKTTIIVSTMQAFRVEDTDRCLFLRRMTTGMLHNSQIGLIELLNILIFYNVSLYLFYSG